MDRIMSGYVRLYLLCYPFFVISSDYSMKNYTPPVIEEFCQRTVLGERGRNATR